jgi:hypothetical protein
MTTVAITDCGCGSAGVTTGSATGAGTGTNERTRFYPRQIVQAPDLTQDQTYFREKLRRHNRLMHGWGIVCGVRVRLGDKPGTVVVEPGYVLGPFGDEIVVGDLVEVDVATQNLDGEAVNGCADPDPWCADVRVPRAEGQPVYLAISFAEYACRPVSLGASGCGCGCGDEECEYSRVRDSWRIRVLDTLPATYPSALAAPSLRTAIACPPRLVKVGPDGQPMPSPSTDCACPTCAPCPTDPWVVLADMTVKGGAVSRLDCDTHRRYAASFRDFFYTCGSETLGRLFRDEVAVRLAGAADVAAAVAAEPVTGLNLDLQWTDKLAERVQGVTIARALVQNREDFIANLSADLHGAAADPTIERLGELWDKANRAWGLANR